MATIMTAIIVIIATISGRYLLSIGVQHLGPLRMYTPTVIQDHDLFHAPLTQVLNRFKVSCMAEFDPLLVQQIPEEARHFPNPMSMALMAMKMPMGKPAW